MHRQLGRPIRVREIEPRQISHEIDDNARSGIGAHPQPGRQHATRPTVLEKRFEFNADDQPFKRIGTAKRDRATTIEQHHLTRAEFDVTPRLCDVASPREPDRKEQLLGARSRNHP
ncbi:hypothetical protein GCM10011591_31850 [Nocardia camponoti]|uniref:Uncharacterized protein n=1 Tax=Nocardia camponoti TaxID=1616106 RepID=A0A917VAH3_9NOCA|nr:hypothetical protein GCM10011591_31850 [Nocardia camponoti]